MIPHNEPGYIGRLPIESPVGKIIVLLATRGSYGVETVVERLKRRYSKQITVTISRDGERIGVTGVTESGHFRTSTFQIDESGFTRDLAYAMIRTVYDSGM